MLDLSYGWQRQAALLRVQAAGVPSCNLEQLFLEEAAWIVAEQEATLGAFMEEPVFKRDRRWLDPPIIEWKPTDAEATMEEFTACINMVRECPICQEPRHIALYPLEEDTLFTCYCPHYREGWHNDLVQLRGLIETGASAELVASLQQDWDEVFLTFKEQWTKGWGPAANSGSYDAIPGRLDELSCGICYRKMGVRRNQLYGCLGSHKIVDLFLCPSLNAPWHSQASWLHQIARSTPSTMLADYCKEELVEITRSQQPTKEQASYLWSWATPSPLEPFWNLVLSVPEREAFAKLYGP